MVIGTMLGIFPIDIFPHQAFDNSILTPVLIGLVFLLIFTELFGWVFVGYVVPGYLAVIFLTFPESGIAITIEAIITYQLVVLLSEWGARAGLWSRFFGRERFLLFVYVSIVVRLLMESIVFPKISMVISSYTHLNFRDEFFSIGLVLVPLLANSFWKTGLSKGLAQRGIITLLVYTVLALVLLPYTNLNLSSFELTYENLAMDFSSAPKVYIILLTGALIASQFNVKFGWDYNGIMVPALLAIAFFMPIKVLSTVGEAMIAAMVFAAITSMPIIKRLDFGGGRQITTVFFLSYILKWILASFFPTFPGMRATDLFGFGYVLPSLMAVKILQKHNSLKVVLPTIYTAFYSLLIGSIIGFSFIVAERFISKPTINTSTKPKTINTEDTPFLFHDMMLAKAYVVRSTYAIGRKATLASISYAAKVVEVALEQEDSKQVCGAISKINPPANITKFICDTKHAGEQIEYAVVHESARDISDLKGLGYMIFFPRNKGAILIVPYPIRESLSIEAAYLLASTTNARAILFAGVDDENSNAVWADASRDRLSVIQTVYERLNGDDVIMVRVSDTPNTKWHIRYKLPESVRVRKLRERVGNVKILWHAPSNAPIQWRTSAADFSIITIPQKILKEASIRHIFAGKLKKFALPISISGLIEKWIVERKDFILPAKNGEYKPPTWQERSLMKNDVISPLLDISIENPDNIDIERLATARLVAKFLDYDIVWFTDKLANAQFFIITQSTNTKNKGWGTFVIRIGNSKPWMFLPPRPLTEKGTIAYASNWFEKSRAKALFIPGAAYNSDIFLRSDILNTSAPRTMAYVATREFIDTFGNESDLLVCVLRGTRIWKLHDAEALISTGFEISTPDNLPQSISAIKKFLSNERKIKVSLFTGNIEELSLLGIKNPIVRLVRSLHPYGYTSIWLSYKIRASITDGKQLQKMLNWLRTLRIPYTLETDDAYAKLLKHKDASKCRANSNFAELLKDFTLYNNLNALKSLASNKCIKLRAAVDLRKTQLIFSATDKIKRCINVYGPIDTQKKNCFYIGKSKNGKK